MPSDLPPPPTPPEALLPPPIEAAPSLAEPPRRLHPFSMVRGIPVRSLAGALAPLFFIATSDDIPGVAIVFGLVAATVLLAVLRFLSWQRHTYEFTDGRIIERSGIIARSERALEVARIQQVDVERTLSDRAVGTCELRLETAADSGDSELTLRVVAVAEADRLRALLAAGGGGPASAATTPGTTPALPAADGAPATANVVFPGDEPAGAGAGETLLVKVSLKHVAFAAVTGRRLLAIPLAFAALVGLVIDNEAVDTAADIVGDTAARLGLVGVVLAVIAGIVLAFVGTAVVGVLRDGGFVIVRRGDDLAVRRGLTTTRSATVPLRRVQRVTVQRSWLHARLGFARVTVHSAGGGAGADPSTGAAVDRSLTVPLMRETDVDGLLHHLLDVGDTPALHAHPLAARRRAVVRSLLGYLWLILPTIAAGIVLVQPLLFALVPAWLALGVWHGLRAYGWLASGVSATAVAHRAGVLGSSTAISPLRKTQGTSVRTSWFQRRRGLASLSVSVAGPSGGITLTDLGTDEANRLATAVLR